jgi:hypothetical protein
MSAYSEEKEKQSLSLRSSLNKTSVLKGQVILTTVV